MVTKMTPATHPYQNSLLIDAQPFAPDRAASDHLRSSYPLLLDIELSGYEESAPYHAASNRSNGNLHSVNDSKRIANP
jgi:hypothetical protein